MHYLTEDAIHVWIGNAENPIDENNLSAQEQLRAQRFVMPIHRQRFIYARSQLRNILAYYLKLPAHEIVFAYHEHGKPYLPQYPDLQFNLAHSQNLVVYAFTLKHALGIDVEFKKMRPFLAMAKRFFSTEELHALQKLEVEQQTELFYHIWSCKEALIKATGKGLSLSLNQFSVPLSAPFSCHPESPATTTENCAEGKVFLENQSWSIYPIQISPSYSAALACTQAKLPLFYFDVNRDLKIKDEL